MEDGIERSIIIDDNNLDVNYIYLYIEDNNDLNTFIIINDKYSAIEYSKKKLCKVYIFINNEKQIYIPTSAYYENGKYFSENK